MAKKLELAGNKFNRWNVLWKVEIGKPGTYWICRCDCGNYGICKGADLKFGNTKSCGCLQKQTVSKLFTKHGLRNTKLYDVWHGMKCRCYNVKNKKYKRYGARGITMCDEWKNNFTSFYNWALQNGYKEGLTIDRINNDGNYEPKNCRWVTVIENSNNTSKNVRITYNNETHNLSEWARKIKVSDDTIRWRLKKYGLCERVFAPCNTAYRNSRVHNLSNKQ